MEEDEVEAARVEATTERRDSYFRLCSAPN
jgi:hypothetical protein